MWRSKEKQIFEFMHEFDICPSLLSKSVAFQVFSHTKDAEIAIYIPAGLDILSI